MARYKLVRDNVPAIIEEQTGQKPDYKVASPKRADRLARFKLVEESKEILKATTREELLKELADLKEVIEKVERENDIKTAEVRRIQHQRRQERGAFTKNYIWRPS